MLEITAKQKKFADAYIRTGNVTASAKEAGYAHPEVQGSRLLTNVRIQDYIKQITNKTEQENIMSITEIKEFWSSVVKDNKQKMQDRLKAAELLGKSAGMFLDKVQVDGCVDVVNIQITGDGDAD